MAIFEVILDQSDRDWWRDYRTRLERDFRQKRILMMLQPVDVV